MPRRRRTFNSGLTDITCAYVRQCSDIMTKRADTALMVPKAPFQRRGELDGLLKLQATPKMQAKPKPVLAKLRRNCRPRPVFRPTQKAPKAALAKAEGLQSKERNVCDQDLCSSCGKADASPSGMLPSAANRIRAAANRLKAARKRNATEVHPQIGAEDAPGNEELFADVAVDVVENKDLIECCDENEQEFFDDVAADVVGDIDLIDCCDEDEQATTSDRSPKAAPRSPSASLSIKRACNNDDSPGILRTPKVKSTADLCCVSEFTPIQVRLPGRPSQARPTCRKVTVQIEDKPTTADRQANDVSIAAPGTIAFRTMQSEAKLPARPTRAAKLFASPKASSGAFEVVGAGDSRFNGWYQKEASTYNGKDHFSKVGFPDISIYFGTSSSKWNMWDNVGGIKYSSVASGANDPPRVWETALEGTSPPPVIEAPPPICPSCATPMTWSDYDEDGYSLGWTCNNQTTCGTPLSSDWRWFCKACSHDFCSKCHPAPKQAGPPPRCASPPSRPMPTRLKRKRLAESTCSVTGSGSGHNDPPSTAPDCSGHELMALPSDAAPVGVSLTVANVPPPPPPPARASGDDCRGRLGAGLVAALRRHLLRVIRTPRQESRSGSGELPAQIAPAPFPPPPAVVAPAPRRVPPPAPPAPPPAQPAPLKALADSTANPKYKMSLCKYFEKGFCVFQEHCNYAHGAHELPRGAEVQSAEQKVIPPESNELERLVAQIVVNNTAVVKSRPPSPPRGTLKGPPVAPPKPPPQHLITKYHGLVAKASSPIPVVEKGLLPPPLIMPPSATPPTLMLGLPPPVMVPPLGLPPQAMQVASLREELAAAKADAERLRTTAASASNARSSEERQSNVADERLEMERKMAALHAEFERGKIEMERMMAMTRQEIVPPPVHERPRSRSSSREGQRKKAGVLPPWRTERLEASLVPKPPDGPPPDFSKAPLVPKPPDGPPPDPNKAAASSQKEHIVPVSDVLFTQESIGSRFRDGRTLKSLIRALLASEVDPMWDSFLCLKAVHLHGTYFSLANRRLHCLKKFQEQVSHVVKIRLSVTSVEDDVIKDFLQRFTSSSGGESVTIRKSVWQSMGRGEFRSVRGQKRSWGDSNDRDWSHKRRRCAHSSA